MKTLILLLFTFNWTGLFSQYFISEIKSENLLYVYGRSSKLDISLIMEINNTSICDSVSGSVIERHLPDTNYYLFCSDTVKYYTRYISSSRLLYEWIFYPDGKLRRAVKYRADGIPSSISTYIYCGAQLKIIEQRRNDTLASSIEYFYKSNSLIGFNVYRSDGTIDYKTKLVRRRGVYRSEILQKGGSECITTYKSKKSKKLYTYFVSNSCNSSETKFVVSGSLLLMESAWENGAIQYSKSYSYNERNFIDKIISYKSGKIIATTTYVYTY